MANTQAYFGLRPKRHLLAGGFVPQHSKYFINSSYTTKIHFGDPVKPVAAGYIEDAAAGDTNIRGVFQGCEYTDSSGKKQFSPYWTGESGASNIIAYITDDPFVVYEVQADDNTTISQANIHQNADFAQGTGDDQSGTSGAYLDTSTLTTGAAQLRILGPSEKPGNTLGDFVKLEVLINEHDLKGTGTSGT